MKVCKVCGEEKPDKAFALARRVCRACVNKQQRIRRGVPAERPIRHCAYCGADITFLQYKRIACDAPECQKKWHEEVIRRRKLPPKRKTKPRPISRRKCRLCGRPIDNGNRFFCAECHAGMNILDGNWLYC